MSRIAADYFEKLDAPEPGAMKEKKTRKVASQRGFIAGPASPGRTTLSALRRSAFKRAQNFEDAAPHEAARFSHIDRIATRNTADFRRAAIPVRLREGCGRLEKSDRAKQGAALSEGCKMVEAAREGSGWLWIMKHTGFVHGIFQALGPCGAREGGSLTGRSVDLADQALFSRPIPVSPTHTAFLHRPRRPMPELGRLDQFRKNHLR